MKVRMRDWNGERMRRMRRWERMGEKGRVFPLLLFSSSPLLSPPLSSSLLEESGEWKIFSSYSRKERSLRVSFILLLSSFLANATYTETHRCVSE